MAKDWLMEFAQEELEELIASYKGLGHIHIKRRGKSLTLCSDSPHGPDVHAKLTARGRDIWSLSLPRHTGRWEKTPFIGPMPQVVSTLTDMLGFHLAPRS